MGEEWYRRQGIDVVDVDRGGKVTYHGPGQLVGYPIMRVTDVMAHVRTMEQAIVTALADEGLPGARGRSQDGRATSPAPGSASARWPRSASTSPTRSPPTASRSTSTTTCSPSRVVACGLPDVRMTSITREVARGDHLPCFRKRMAFRFAEAFGRRQRLLSAARLEAAVGVVPVPA